MSSMPDKRLRDELQATLDARRDLGPEYESALIDSFVERLDATIAARVRAELDHHDPVRSAPRRHPMVPIALGSLGIGVPLTAVAASAGGAGLLVAWMAIVVINVAAAVAIMRRS
ncbi:hypothetical protein BKM31_23770 [[Actinomadura] parvosata subsp. kistnae]|uniref:Integral membrane protein n=2 Tax=Nonomuraea TaxID=83681 RepID=A0A1V0AK90_9ACTN|nr:hypothetical protein BKM31_23770 [Nonomuraea sp. ATCC 55076]